MVLPVLLRCSWAKPPVLKSEYTIGLKGIFLILCSKTQDRSANINVFTIVYHLNSD